MFRSLAILPLLLAAPSALAADRQLDLEFTSIHSSDPGWALFSDYSGLPGLGIRAGLPLHERLLLLVDVNRSWSHNGVDVEGESFRGSYLSYGLAAGVRGELTMNRVFRPYALLQATGSYGTVRLDGDPESDSNPDELVEHAFSPGLLGGLGLELRVGMGRDVPGRLAGYLELGYGRSLNAHYGELGDLSFGGLAVRYGVGYRF